MRATSGSSSSDRPAISQNVLRQSAYSTMAAPATGPSAGMVDSAMATMASAFTASASSKRRRISAGTATVAAPAPKPCSRRPASIASIPGASAQTRLPPPSCKVPAMMVRRSPKWSAAQPHASCDRASAAMNRAMVAWAAGMDAPSSAAITGMAGRYRSDASRPNAVRLARGTARRWSACMAAR
jgi:hypothetical protein